MTKQLLKGFWAASLVVALAVLSVPAQAAEIRAKIPFSFTVNGKTLPAGTYSVSSEAAQGVLLVRGFGHGARGLREGEAGGCAAGEREHDHRES